MAAAPKYVRQQNFNNDASRGLDSPEPAKLDTEFDAIQETANQTRNRLEGVLQANGQLKPNQKLNSSLTEINDPDEYIASGALPETFVFSTAIDITSNLVHVYKNGELQPTADYTVTNADVELDTVASDTVAVHFYDVQGAALTTLAATGGSALIGFDDDSGYGPQQPITGTPTTVKEAADLALINTANLGDALFPLSQWVKTDGTAPLVGNWDLGGTFRIQGALASTADGDLVEHTQLVAVQAAISGLGILFVAVDGSSVMTADLDMGAQRLVNLATGTSSGHAVEFAQYTAGLAGKLSLDGSLPMTGGLNMNNNNIALGAGVATTNTTPTTGDMLTNKSYVDTQIAAAAASNTVFATATFTLTHSFGHNATGVSAGVYDLTIPAGGANGENDTRSGGGGGGGGYASYKNIVSQGDIFRITVGVGAAAQLGNGSAGNAGGGSFVQNQAQSLTYAAAGGGGGAVDPAVTGTGGVGGSGTIGTSIAQGKPGGDGELGGGTASVGGNGGLPAGMFGVNVVNTANTLSSYVKGFTEIAGLGGAGQGGLDQTGTNGEDTFGSPGLVTITLYAG